MVTTTQNPQDELTKTEHITIASDELQKFEGFRSEAYADKALLDKKKVLYTIGFGNTIYEDGTAVKSGDKIDIKRGLALLRFKIFQIDDQLCARIPKYDRFDKYQKAALISFSYNCGEYFFGNSKFKSMTALLSGNGYADKARVANVFKLYSNRGVLTNRRIREAALFNGEIK